MRKFTDFDGPEAARKHVSEHRPVGSGFVLRDYRCTTGLIPPAPQRATGWERSENREGRWILEAGDQSWALVYYANGELEGEAWFLRSNGYLWKTGSFHHWNEQGEWYYFDAGGKLLGCCEYDAGQHSGRFQSFHPNGNIQSDGIINRGRGEMQEFDEAGRLLGRGGVTIEKDQYYKRTGHWELCDSDGETAAIGQLENSRKVGRWAILERGQIVDHRDCGDGSIGADVHPLLRPENRRFLEFPAQVGRYLLRDTRVVDLDNRDDAPSN